MKKNKRISLKTAILIAVLVGLVILAIVFINLKHVNNESENDSSNISTREAAVIQNIRNTFDSVREEFVVNNATIEGYNPTSCDIDSDGNGTGTAFDLKNFVISKLGENVIDESGNTVVELNLDMFQKEEGQQIELINGYHVYLSNGEDDEKFITIVYKDDVFCHGMAHYDTQNNLIIDSSNTLYPVLVAQIRLSENDLSYYLEPVKSINN